MCVQVVVLLCIYGCAKVQVVKQTSVYDVKINGTPINTGENQQLRILTDDITSTSDETFPT